MFVDTKTIRMKSLETVGVVRDNAETGHVVLIGFHLQGYRVISNDADRFNRFYVLFFLSTNAPSYGTRVAFQWLRCFTCVTPTRSGRFRFIDSVWPTKHLFGHDRP